jgi:hypothetical protein
VDAEELDRVEAEPIVLSVVGVDDQQHAEETAAASAQPGQALGNGRESQAEVLVEITLDTGCELWHTSAGEAYVTIPVGNHREHWPVPGKSFRRWLASKYYAKTSSVPGRQAEQDALRVLEGMAIYEGAEQGLYVRMAAIEDTIYLDLADRDWRAVEISPGGWRTVERPPVRFHRARAMLSLPEPCANGNLEDLRRLVNVTDEDWPLVVAWLLAAYRPVGPYPILALHGEQGSTKTTTARMLRCLVDPNGAPVRSEPKEPRDLMIAASNSWIVALDNLSRIPAWLSDALCRLSTGGGFSTRQLYTNSEEAIFDAQRPVIMTGIEELATRSDLVDRTLMITLPRVRDAHRRTEEDLWAEFNRLRPGILGCLLTAVSNAMRNSPSISLPELPRLADFAKWSVAGEESLGLKPGAFMAAYAQNRTAGNELALESTAVAQSVRELMADKPVWKGAASELLEVLEQKADRRARSGNGWPKDGTRLSGVLKRLAPNLRQVGIEVEFGRTGKGRFVNLVQTGP